ncbi:hypothetical protein LCGC14_3035670, partial [marine sediment metagenome]
MNSATFNRLMNVTDMKCHPPEWMMFMEICDLYLKRNKIKNPVVAHLGPKEDRRFDFFKQILNARRAMDVHQEPMDILFQSFGEQRCSFYHPERPGEYKSSRAVVKEQDGRKYLHI